MSFLDEAPDVTTKLSVIETLRTVTEGKVWMVVGRYRNAADTDHRSSSKLSELELRGSCPTSRRNKAISMQQQISYVNYKSRPLGQWTGGKRQSLSLSRWHYALRRRIGHRLEFLVGRSAPNTFNENRRRRLKS